MAIPFLKGIDVSGAVDLSNLTIDGAQGTDGQVLTSTGSGIAWEDASGGASLSGGEASKVAVWSATDTLTHNDNFHFDTTNVRLGIGDSNPNRTLVVSETRTGSTASDAYTAIVKSVQSSGASPNPGTGGLKVQYTSSSSNVHAFGLVAGSSSSDFLTTGPMHFYTNSDLDTVSATGFAMQLDTSQRLILGSTTGTQKLNVDGNVKANRYYGHSSTAYYVDPDDGTASAILNGAVSVGSGSVYTKFTVSTPAGYGDGADGIFIRSQFAGGSPVVSDKDPFLSIGCADSSSAVSTIFMGQDATATSQETKIEYSHDNDTLSIYKSQMGSYVEHVRFGNINSSGTARTRFYGNVGIGADPSEKLHVSGGKFLVSDSAYTEMAVDQTDSGKVKIGISSGTAEGFFMVRNDEAGHVASAPEFKILLNDSEKVRLDSTGLGIGTNSPSAKLHVSGGHLRVDNSGGTDNYYLEFYESGAQRFRIYENSNNVYFDGGPGNTHFRPRQGGGSNNFIVTGANVGIGESNPASPLHVSGTARITEGITTDGNSKFYTWRALNNTSNSSNQYYRIARITASQSSRFIIELAGRSTSYTDGDLPAFGKIVGQLNNDNNYDIVYYNASATDEVVDEIGQVDVSTTATDIYVRVGQYAELTATAHLSDGTITTYGGDSASTSAPTGYVQATEYKLWNTGNDGSGSGLDADKVDNLEASQFLRSDAHDTFTGKLSVGSTSSRSAGVYGIYDSTKTGHIWSMGTAYAIPNDGSNFGNLYGLAYKHTNNTTGGTMGGSHQVVWCNNGVARGSIGYNAVWHAESMKAPIFYDSINTAYYVDPNNTSFLKDVNVHGTFRFQRSATTQTGQDDNVSVTVGDSDITFKHNNDDDGDASVYNFQYTSGGSAVNILNFASNYANFTTPYVRCNNNSTDYAQLEANSSGGVLKAVSNNSTNVLFRSYGDSYTTNSFGIGTSAPVSNARLTVVGGGQTFGVPGNGANTGGRWLSFEGNADSGGEGSGRLFFSEHNSSTSAMDNYGMSIGYRGGSTSVTTAGGNSWSGLSQIGNGQWGMWGHDNSLAGALIMYGDRNATFVNFAGNDITNVGNLTLSGGNGILVDSAGHANLQLDRASTSYDNNLLYRTAGTIKWRLWQDGSDDYLYVRNESGTNNVMTWRNNNTVGINTGTPNATLHLQVPTSGAPSIFLQAATNYTPGIYFDDSNTGTSAAGAITYLNANNTFNIKANSSSVITISSGTTTIAATADIVAYSSDKRLKENVQPIEKPLNKVLKLEGVTYNWNKKAEDVAGFDTKIKEVGLFAQDVQKVLPEAVKLAPFDTGEDFKSKSGEDYLTVQYEKIVPLLVEAIKDQQRQIDELKSIINGSS